MLSAALDLHDDMCLGTGHPNCSFYTWLQLQFAVTRRAIDALVELRAVKLTVMIDDEEDA
jgi:hypothetical protein